MVVEMSTAPGKLLKTDFFDASTFCAKDAKDEAEMNSTSTALVKVFMFRIFIGL
jgi:hypothetical protein